MNGYLRNEHDVWLTFHGVLCFSPIMHQIRTQATSPSIFYPQNAVISPQYIMYLLTPATQKPNPKRRKNPSGTDSINPNSHPSYQSADSHPQDPFLVLRSEARFPHGGIRRRRRRDGLSMCCHHRRVCSCSRWRLGLLGCPVGGMLAIR